MRFTTHPCKPTESAAMHQNHVSAQLGRSLPPREGLDHSGCRRAPTPLQLQSPGRSVDTLTAPLARQPPPSLLLTTAELAPAGGNVRRLHEVRDAHTACDLRPEEFSQASPFATGSTAPLTAKDTPSYAGSFH